MNTIELFSGTASFSKVAKEYGHEIWRVDNGTKFEVDYFADVRKLPDSIPCDVLWASPPCEAFSVASIGRNWKGDKFKREPKSASATLGLELLEKTALIISVSKPTYWFIENPRGMMRKVINDVFRKYGIRDVARHTVSYCQYGDTRMKPTDIWTNFKEWRPRPMCRNGDTCHVRAPRGSKTGTQGLKNATDRGVIPPAIFHEVFRAIGKESLRGKASAVHDSTEGLK